MTPIDASARQTGPTPRRPWRSLLILSTLAGSWYGMMAVHETGHVLAAWATGGTVSRVVLHPLTISRTDLGYNPAPLAVCWAGPVFGALAPAAAFGLATLAGRPEPVLRFFAGFCLVANGAYIGAGWFDRVGDAGDLLRNGAPAWQLWLFGLVTVPTGVWAWHGLGPSFGLGRGASPVRAGRALRVVTVASLILLGCALVGGE